jgi:hypothetical protein
MNPNQGQKPDSDIEEQLTDDIAVQGATEGENVEADGEAEASEDEEAAEMEEVQEEAAHEREEGGYQ